jgi:hypothetical protein
MPAAVSTCGANTTAGFLGADGGHHLVDRRGRPGRLRPVADAARLQHGCRLGRDPAHLEDLRPAVAEPAVADDQHRLPAANWRATASMPKVPLPGTSTAERAWYTSFSMAEMSCITPWKRLDMWLSARSV